MTFFIFSLDRHEIARESEDKQLASDKVDIKIKSLHKALTVLDCFAEKQPLSITEISDKLGLYKSNVYDILTTFAAMGYLDKSEESSKFFVGKKLIRLGPSDWS